MRVGRKVTNRNTKTDRIIYLDSLKGFCILLVVFCHWPMLGDSSFFGNVVMSLAWAAVPCFMMVSGGLMHKSSKFIWKKYFVKIIKTYLVIVVWRLIYLIAYYAFSTITITIPGVIYYVFFFGDLNGVNADVMWYMISYLVVMLLFPVTYFAYKNDDKKLFNFLLVLSFISGILIPSLSWLVNQIYMHFYQGSFNFANINQIIPFSNYPNMIFYFLIGAYMLERQNELKKKFFKNIIIPIILVLVGVLGLLCVKRLDAGTWLWENTYLTYGYSRFCTAIMSIGLYQLFAMIPWNLFHALFASLWGKTTMGIYYMHYVLLGVLNIILIPTLGINGTLTTNIIKTIIIASICSLVTFVLRKVPVIKEIVV